MSLKATLPISAQAVAERSHPFSPYRLRPYCNSYIYLATYALPHLEASHGALSVVSSGAGQMGLPKVAPYAATKHALRKWRRILFCLACLAAYTSASVIFRDKHE